MLVQYVFSVAVLNLLIGFAMAVFLRRRYELMIEGRNPSSGALPPLGWWGIFSPKTAFLRVLHMVRRGPRSADPESEQGTAPAVAAGEPSGQVAEHPEPHAGSSPDRQDVSAVADPAEMTDLSTDRPETEAEPQREKQPVEQAVDRLRSYVEQHGEELADLDTAMRTAEASDNDQELRAKLSRFQETARRYLEQRDRTWEELAVLAASSPGAGEAAGQLRQALDAEVLQIDQTQERFAIYTEAADLGEYQRELRAESAKMLRANDAVHDAVNRLDAAVAVDVAEQEEIGLAGRTDPLTGLPDRRGLEAKLAEFWAEGGAHRRLVAVMIDVDQMTRVNETYGYRVGNRVLAALAKLLRATARDRAMVSRFSGQRFVLLVPDADLRSAVNLAEQVRQTVETTAFEYRESTIHITVSCGVAECRSDDSTATLYARGEATLREAKRYGRNRSFAHDGKYPTPVVPPNLTLTEKSIPI